jgi:pimeloyl-ACP methyl ester carboxylesterase
LTDARVSRRYVDLQHGQIHLRIAEPPITPTQPPLICLHPSPISSQVYATLLPVMATDRVVIAIDTPGYGNSDPLPEPPSIEAFAAAIWPAIAATTEAPQVDLFGYHTGSAIALELARLQSKRVRCIVLNSALMFSDAERVEFRANFQVRAGRSATDRLADLGTAWAGWRAHWADVPDDETAWPMFIASQLRPTGMSDGFFAAFAHDFPAALKAVPHPIMILNPSDDLHEMTLRVTPLLRPGIHIRALPGWNHGFLDAWPHESAAILRDFLDTRTG